MEEKYFGNRQNATKASEEEMEVIFKCVADHFSLKWLKSNRTHPLQQLWNRKDALSTNELFSFGSCLQRLAAIDSKWTKNQIKHIKEDYTNNRIGAFFEINGLGILNSPQQQTIPASGNNPGFDGTLMLYDKKTMRLSLKNYGDSAFYKEFSAFGKKVEDCVQKTLKEKNISSIQIIIDAVNAFPGKSEWDSLIKNIPEVLGNMEKSSSNAYSIDGFWLFMYGDIRDDYQDFHPAFNSYQLILLANHHKNEDRNLLSKLEEACANLTAHSKLENDTIINAVFIHLPESASMSQCKEWSEKYFLDFPDKPISCIILYQPKIASDLEKDINFIHQYFQIIIRVDKYVKWNLDSKKINFEIPIGIISEAPSVNKLIAVTDGEKKEIIFNGKYIYQRGNYYLEAKKEADGTLTGNIKRIASGIFAHSVFQPFPDQQPLALSGHFAPTDKLLIL